MASAVLPFLAALKNQIPQQAPEVDVPPPDLSVGQPTPPPQPPPSPLDDLTQGMAQGAPKLAPETKGHKLLQILMGGLSGAAAGAGQRTFGGGFQTAQMFPIQRGLAQQELTGAGLKNQQLYQMLPFLRAQTIFGLQKTAAETQKNQAEAGKANAEAGAIPTKTALEQAQTEASYYKEDPNMGLVDLRTGQPVNPAGVAPLTPEEAQVLGKQPGERVPLKIKNTANEIVSRGLGTVAGANDTFVVNKGTGQTSPLHIGSPRAMFAPSERFVQVADPNNPGNITYMKAGQAAQQGMLAPSSAAPQAAKAVTKSAVAGKIGDEINAFNTAMAHADLLRKAFTALNNGDVRALNSLKNRWETEMGSPLPTNVNAISNAYSREITKMLSSGHMTDAEIGSSGATLPQNASPAQLLGALNAYQSLAQSKMEQRQHQVERGQKGEANFPQQQHVIQIGNQHYRYKGTGATDDLRNYEPI